MHAPTRPVNGRFWTWSNAAEFLRFVFGVALGGIIAAASSVAYLHATFEAKADHVRDVTRIETRAQHLEDYVLHHISEK